MWFDACAQFRKDGSTSGLIDALVKAGLSLDLVDVLVAAIRNEQKLQAALMSAPTRAQLQASEDRIAAARKNQDHAGAEAEYNAATGENYKLWASAGNAERMRQELVGLRNYFPELFGVGEPGKPLHSGGRLHADVMNALRPLSLNPHETPWTLHGKPAEVIAAATGRRVRRASTMNGPEPGTLAAVVAADMAQKHHSY